MTVNEIREKFLKFMKEKGHVVVPSSSLIPENDPTTLFTGSGMQPMITYLLGAKHPLGDKIADSQKCFRTADIEEVGDSRHTTFFEMLGNWSLGDYFKEEQINWIFSFLVEELKLDPNRLYISVFRGREDLGISKDTEAVEIWKEVFKNAGINVKDADFAEKNGIKEGERIFYYDEKKNWWSRAGVPENMPIGEPGGPDSEVFWDFGKDLKIHENSQFKDQPCHINCDCGRFFEIGNSVFMTYLKTEKGFVPLAQKNIDFGGGLERMAVAVNDNPDIFLIDIFEPLVENLEKISGKKYADDTVAFRVILDHLRAATFLISDGATPSNKDQGYFTRRLIRRVVRFGHKLGIKNNFCGQMAEEVIKKYSDHYDNLDKNREKILKELNSEEEKFRETLEKGIKQFEKISNKSISGYDAFILFSTYGFPIEMTQELAKEKEVEVDMDEFKKEMEKHQELSRTAAAGKFKGGLADATEETTKLHTAAHLLLASLRKVLGSHVGQKGSNITAERLRLDFSHPEKMTEEQKKEVEKLVNEIIKKDLPVVCEEMTLNEAKEKGALGAFEHKYEGKVKVYMVNDFSKEICGGPHVEKIGKLGEFKIIKEEASSAGVRRIKAILK